MNLDPARVLLVDDSAVTKRIVAGALTRDPRIQIVGTAANGMEGLAEIERLRPEIVLLDVEMPVLDGIATLEALRRVRHSSKVIMFSNMTERGARVTLEALLLGAVDYVTKPLQSGSLAAAQAHLRDELVPKILGLLPRFSTRAPIGARHSSPPPSISGERSIRPVRRASRIDVVMIGASTGGPSALNVLLPKLVAPLPVPVLVVQHMPPMFTGSLADRLDKLCPFPVSEARDGEELEANHVYIAPGGLHLGVIPTGSGLRHLLRVYDGPAEHSCRPAVDVLARSVVKSFGSSTLSVILTGMGKDGLAGCQLIRSAGGQVISQDKHSSVVWGMPGWVARMGATDCVLPLDDIADEIGRRVAVGRSVPALRVGAGHR